MAVSDWSTTPADNTMLGTITLGEGVMTVGQVNNAIRELMAQIATWSAGQPDASNMVTKSGGVFSGTQPRYDGRGAYLHWNDSALLSGRQFLLPDGSPVPTGFAPGDWLLGY